MYDTNEKTVFGQGCRYMGRDSNLYNSGASFEFSELIKLLYPTIYGNLDVYAINRRKARIDNSYKNSRMDYQSESFNNFTLVGDETNHNSPLFGKIYGFGRRRTLFNLYAFAHSDSY